jgi:hypothetical protein
MPRPVVTVDPLLTEADVARELQVRGNFLAKLRCSGNGPPFIRIGGKIRYRRSALIAWLDGRERRSTSERSLSARSMERLDHRLGAAS